MGLHALKHVCILEHQSRGQEGQVPCQKYQAKPDNENNIRLGYFYLFFVYLKGRSAKNTNVMSEILMRSQSKNVCSAAYRILGFFGTNPDPTYITFCGSGRPGVTEVCHLPRATAGCRSIFPVRSRRTRTAHGLLRRLRLHRRENLH